MKGQTGPMSDEVRLEVADRVMTLTLNRPEKMNAFTAQMMNDLLEAFDRADADDDVRVVIVTGEGRAFCAGADLSSGGGTFDAGDGAGRGKRAPRDGGGRVALRIFELKKPVIAAINGPAVGVGITMCLPMDIRIASRAARIGFVFARRGIVPEATSSWFLPRIVGLSQAMEWVATGRVFSADEALAGRLVSRVVEPDELLLTARSIAREIIDNTAPVSVALSRQLVLHMAGASHPMDAHRADSIAIYQRGRSADVREGVQAFLEKRPAVFPDLASSDVPDIGLVDPTYDI